MKKTDMELQAIRDKLRLLEAEPPVGDVLSVPWSSPQQSSPQQSSPSFGSAPFGSAAQSVRQSPASTQAPRQSGTASKQAVAIEALKQRSGTQTAHNSRADELISQEIYRMEVHAQNINERSQQQAADILALKRSAQQATLAIRRQGIHSHPQLDIIAKFLEQYPSAAVPHLARDSQGHFALSHNTVNLHHAEQEALNTAETLRNRQTVSERAYQSTGQSTKRNASETAQSTLVPASYENPFERSPFAHPVAAGPSVDEYLEEETTPSRHHSRHSRKGQRWALDPRRLFGRMRGGAGRLGGGSGFSWIDGAIWFSGAAIARIMIESIVLSYPILRMPLLLILFSAISLAIYRVVVSKSTNLTSAYRLGITLLGLFLGSSL
ncbi:MAG: hypothetical protein AAF810_13655 [Cyanobacteria bacterium P01_D01_bin.36]